MATERPSSQRSLLAAMVAVVSVVLVLVLVLVAVTVQSARIPVVVWQGVGGLSEVIRALAVNRSAPPIVRR